MLLPSFNIVRIAHRISITASDNHSLGQFALGYRASESKYRIKEVGIALARQSLRVKTMCLL